MMFKLSPKTHKEIFKAHYYQISLIKMCVFQILTKYVYLLKKINLAINYLTIFKKEKTSTNNFL